MLKIVLGWLCFAIAILSAVCLDVAITGVAWLNIEPALGWLGFFGFGILALLAGGAAASQWQVDRPSRNPKLTATFTCLCFGYSIVNALLIIVLLAGLIWPARGWSQAGGEPSVSSSALDPSPAPWMGWATRGGVILGLGFPLLVCGASGLRIIDEIGGEPGSITLEAPEFRPENPGHRYSHALALLEAGNVKGYKEACASMLRQFGDLAGGFDLRLMSPLTDIGCIPALDKNLIIVAAVNNILHFRIFDGNGKVLVDTGEKRLAEQARQIENLRKQLENLWPPREMNRSDKGRVVTAVTTIVDHHPASSAPLTATVSQVVYTCLLVPGVADGSQLVTLAGLAENLFPGNVRLRGAAHYRAGNFTLAIQDLVAAGKVFPARAWDLFFLAMAYQRHGQANLARSNLDQAVYWVKDAHRQEATGGPGPWSGWAERVETQQLRREAEELIRG